MASAPSTHAPDSVTTPRPSRVQSEIERKYDVDAVAPLPDLVGAGPVAAAVTEPAVRLEAEYSDTADGALARGRITLRRRVGGADEGWHVKLPGARSRTEIHAPLTASDEVPDAVRAPVLGQIGRAPLAPIARLTTDRTITRLLDADGRELAEVADDLVQARDHVSGLERSWREWEVEIVDAPAETVEALLDAVQERLLAAGAAPASSVSKLARATGRSTERIAPTEPADAGGVALSALGALARELRDIDPWVRLGQDDALHRMRVLTRRLRSVLAVSRRVLDRDEVEHLRSELRWFAGVLGVARDAEVVRERLGGALAATETGPAGERDARTSLLAELDRRHVRAERRVQRTLADDRYLDLLDRLDALVAEPPRTRRAERSVRWFVRSSLGREADRARRARRRGAEAEPAGDHADGPEETARRDDEISEARHDLRKAAKRLRYVAEAWLSVSPDAVRRRERRLASAARALADALGDERDAHAARRMLAAAAHRAEESGERSFELGIAYADEGRRAQEATQSSRTALGRFSRRVEQLR